MSFFTKSSVAEGDNLAINIYSHTSYGQTINQKYTLEDFLDEEDILMEVRNAKNFTKLNIFLDNYKLRRMIDYILKEPKNPNNISLNIEHMYFNNGEAFLQNGNDADINLTFFKIGYKYPYICCEILSSEIQLILDKIIPIHEISLEESKSYLLNLSSDSINTTPAKKEDSNFNEDILILDDIKREPQFLFNPPEIEYGFEKDKEKLSYERDRDKEINMSKDRDISLNTSIDRKYTISNFDNFEILDYLFSFLHNNCNELNSIQASYFSRIVLSFMRSNKCTYFLKYICLKKPENLINLINNIHLSGICDVIIKLLILENPILDESLNLDNIKTSILIRLITKFYQVNNDDMIYSNISFILCEYIDNTKSLDLVLTENILNSFYFNLTKNKFAFKEMLNVGITLMKQFKIEYEKAYKFVTSLSMSKN